MFYAFFRPVFHHGNYHNYDDMYVHSRNSIAVIGESIYETKTEIW